MRKIPVILSCVVAALMLFTACHKDKGDELDIKGGQLLAGGTIPSSAKVYPIVDESLDMSMSDEDGFLSAEDVWALTHYVDLWASIDDNRGEGFKADEVAEFATPSSIDDAKAAIESNNFDYKVDGVQILTMQVEDDRVQVPYIVKLTGKNDKAGIAEGHYEAVHALYFKKVNNRWYEDGVSFLLMAESGTIRYTKDDITGTYSITPLSDYYTE